MNAHSEPAAGVERIVLPDPAAYRTQASTHAGGSTSIPDPVAYREDSRRKIPALATILSLMPGLGQIYVGYYEQGFINALVVASLIAMLSYEVGNLEPIFGFFLAFYWLFNLVDAYRKAVLYNQALAGLGPLELPKEGGAQTGRGSLLGGGLMILVGVFFLAHTRFGYSLAWIERWWPAILVIVGGYLIYKAIVERNKA
jgi:hypothetical protein